MLKVGGGGGIEHILVTQQQHKQTRRSGVDLEKMLITYAVNTLFAFHKTHNSCVYRSPRLDNKVRCSFINSVHSSTLFL